MGIVIAILIFGIMIFVHELGHFTAARLCGVKVEEFAIGMGPKIFKRTSKKTGIIYSLRALPIGGFCKMLGETDDSDAPEALCNRPKWQRFIILFAGAFMNIITAIIVMTVFVANPEPTYTTTIASFPSENTPICEAGAEVGDQIISINGENITSYSGLYTSIIENAENPINMDVLRDGKKISLDEFKFDIRESDGQKIIKRGFEATIEESYYSTTVSAFVSKNSPSYKAGLRQGDTILKIGNENISVFSDISYTVMLDGIEPLDITVERDGKEMVIEDVDFDTEESDGITVGILDFSTTKITKNFGVILSQAVKQSFSTIKIIYKSLFDLITGRYGIEAMSGPVGTIEVISEVASYGWRNILYLFAFISMNLGIFNLLPIPALDGGHIFFLFVEAIRRKPIDPKYENAISFVGFILLFGLMAVVTILDVIKLVG